MLLIILACFDLGVIYHESLIFMRHIASNANTSALGMTDSHDTGVRSNSRAVPFKAVPENDVHGVRKHPNTLCRFLSGFLSRPPPLSSIF